MKKVISLQLLLFFVSYFVASTLYSEFILSIRSARLTSFAPQPANIERQRTRATKYETKDDMYKYYNINADDIKQFAAEVGKSDTDSKNTEVVLVEATDSDAASRVETALTNRYNSIFQQNASYSAEELDMVKNCKVTKERGERCSPSVNFK